MLTYADVHGRTRTAVCAAMREVLEASYALAAFVNETQTPVSTFETWVLESPRPTSQATCEALGARGGGGSRAGGFRGKRWSRCGCEKKKRMLLLCCLLRVKDLL